MFVLDESSMFANLGNDRVCVIKEYYIHWFEAFWEPKTKLGELRLKVHYHTNGESRVHLTWYQSHVLNLVMSIESSNVEQSIVSLEDIVKND